MGALSFHYYLIWETLQQLRELPTNLDIAKQALAAAAHDWQRVQIRDNARAIEAAAAILKRKDIQVQAANLVQEAERAIAKATPSQQNVRQIRHAHNNLTDAEFESAQQEAIET